MEKPRMLELSPAEAQSLLQLLDLAVKAGGLNAAALAVPLAQKVQALVNESHE